MHQWNDKSWAADFTYQEQQLAKAKYSISTNDWIYPHYEVIFVLNEIRLKQY